MVVTVNCTVCAAVLPLKATVAGVNMHCVLVGRPEHAISMPPTYPLIGTRLKLALADPGAETLSVVGALPMSNC